MYKNRKICWVVGYVRNRYPIPDSAGVRVLQIELGTETTTECSGWCHQSDWIHWKTLGLCSEPHLWSHVAVPCAVTTLTMERSP